MNIDRIYKLNLQPMSINDLTCAWGRGRRRVVDTTGNDKTHGQRLRERRTKRDAETCRTRFSRVIITSDLRLGSKRRVAGLRAARSNGNVFTLLPSTVAWIRAPGSDVSAPPIRAFNERFDEQSANRISSLLNHAP